MVTLKETIKYVFTNQIYIGLWFGFGLGILFKLDWTILIIAPIIWVILEYGIKNYFKEE